MDGRPVWSLEWAQISSTSENQHWSDENSFGLVTVVVQCLHFNDENKSYIVADRSYEFIP